MGIRWPKVISYIESVENYWREANNTVKPA